MKDFDPAEDAKDVLFNHEDICEVTPGIVDDLKQKALGSPRRRARFCLHHSPLHPTQEMLIVFHRDSYMPPHRHPVGKSESYHVVEGSMTVFFFDDSGNVIRKVDMAEGSSGKSFLYRLSANIWHMPVPTSEWLVYHETFTGPFAKETDVEHGPWAPPETDHASASAYMMNLLRLHGYER